VSDFQAGEARRQKYAEAIHDVSYGAPDVVDRVLALVDAEIAQVQDEAEMWSQSSADAFAAWHAAEALMEGLPDGIIRNAGIRGDLDRPSVMACAAYVRGTIGGYKIKRDHGVKEPEYEYGFRDEWNVPYPATFSSVEDAQEYVDRRALSPKEYTMTRRRKAGPWEDVK
jgi:hypothetical protein